MLGTSVISCVYSARARSDDDDDDDWALPAFGFAWEEDGMVLAMPEATSLADVPFA